MPVDPNIPLEIGRPAGYGLPLAQDMQAIYNAQNQQYKNYLQNQDIAGQNALRGVLSDPSNLSPSTGLPNAAALAPVAGVNPQTYMDFLLAMQKGQEQQERSNLANFALTQKYNTSFKEEVGKPLVDFEQELLQQNIEPEQRKIMIEQKRKALTDNWQKSNGTPDKIRNAVDRPYDETWPIRNELHDQRVQNIEKGWDKDQYTDNTGTTFRLNKFMGGYWNIDSMTPYHPVGAVHKVGAEPKETAPNLVDVTSQGNVYGVTWDPVAKTYVKDGAPYTPTNLQTIGKASAGAERAPKTPEMVRVPKDSNDPSKGTEVKFATPPNSKDEPWRDQQKNPIPAPLSKVNPGDLDAPGTPEMTAPAATYIGRAKVYGVPIPSTWGTAKWLPQVVDQTIKGSLDLPQDYKPTVQDADAAALNDAAIHAGMHADAQGLQTVAKQNALVQSFEGTALRNLNAIKEIGPKAAAGGDLAWNKWANFVRRNVEISPDLAELDNTITDFKNEYVRIMSTGSASGGAMTSDAARAEGDRLFNVNQPWDVIERGLNRAAGLMENRVSSIKSDYNAHMDAIKAKGKFAEQAPLTPGEGGMGGPAVKPPPGVLEAPRSGSTVPSTSGSASTPSSVIDTKHDSVEDAKTALPSDGKIYPLIFQDGHREYWKKLPDGTLSKVR